MTDAHRPLDDLTRDLRAASQQYVRESDQPFWGYRQSALSLEAADAIDRLRADLKAYWGAAHSFAHATGACAGDDVLAHLENSSARIVELERLAESRGEEIAHLRLQLEPVTADRIAAFVKTLHPNGEVFDLMNDSLHALTSMRARDVAYGLEIEELRAGRVGTTTRLEPFEHDAVATLAPLTAEDGVRRWRRRIDLDGGKYSIFLAETFPPDLDLPGEPKRLPAAFLRDGEPWEIFRYSGFVNALAEALWERAYAPPTGPTPRRPGPTEWTVATAFEQLEKCRYACEGGPLENNVAYRWLKGKIAAATTLGALRPILLDHRLETFFVAGKNGARVCRCGLSFSDSSGWVEHVLEALALTPKDSVLRAFEDDGPPSETLATAWRAVPLTVGLLFDALGRAEHLPFSKGATLDALSCEVERAGRAVVEGKS